MAEPYPGNTQTNASKDAKYTVKREDGDWAVKLVFTLDRRERTLLATVDHDPLVEMVNLVKDEHSGQPGGAFYINEFRDVLVSSPDGVMYAGNYDGLLEFEFEGRIVSPRAPDDLQPGDVWSGPHVGVRHVLAADLKDIYYKSRTGNRERKVVLSNEVGAGPAAHVANRIGVQKGESGRVYINECGELFGPAAGQDHFVYFGHLGEDPWFPKPEV